MVVQRSVVRIVNPANDLASRSAQRLTAVRANHGEHLIQEQMSLRTQFLVRCRLHEEQIVPIQVGIPLPRVHSFIKNQSARIICLLSDILVLFDDLLYTVLIDLLGFNLHGLNVLLQFMLYPLAKAVGDAVLIAVERLLQRDVGGRQRCIPLRHDMMTTEHATERCCAQTNRRCIHLCELHAGLNISRGDVLRQVFLRVSLTFRQLNFPGVHLIFSLVDFLHVGLVLGQNILCLQGRLAGQNGCSYATDCSANHHDGRACFLQLECSLRHHLRCLSHDFFLFHKISVLSISSEEQVSEIR